jgi:hypothetical protein
MLSVEVARAVRDGARPDRFEGFSAEFRRIGGVVPDFVSEGRTVAVEVVPADDPAVEQPEVVPRERCRRRGDEAAN